MTKKNINESIQKALAKADGVSLHGQKIRLSFIYKGIRCRPTLKLPITVANIRYAADKIARIRQEIEKGTFDYAKEFPNCPNAKKFASKSKSVLFKDLAEQFLNIKKAEIDPNTYNGYKKNLKVINEKFGDCKIQDITESDILTWRSLELAENANKYINNIFTPLRGVFALAKSKKLIFDNPLTNIKNLKLPSREPTPLSRSEIETLINHPTAKVSERNMIQFACWSGMRTEEIFALAWEDIDFDRGFIYVTRAIVDGLYKRTKTRRNRKVELLKPAVDALKKQMSISFNDPKEAKEVMENDNKTRTKENIRIVFKNSNSGLPYNDVSVYGKVFWDRHLKSAGIQHRGPNHCRHTYASQLITTGQIELEWIAQQMGTSVNMLYKHYGRIIDRDRKSRAEHINKLLNF
ncbi:DUF3596 domain-containing protein [Kangiella sp.]|uniref:phage integrase n=1 Tax=Kangiella sp. TaxID=1920245 RepID=UPI00198FB54D|nr:DUF3596 domain-containing protein [Kangiella sp.]MBD3652624.1 site-specific integrase [Kangiella sp.]